MRWKAEWLDTVICTHKFSADGTMGVTLQDVFSSMLHPTRKIISFLVDKCIRPELAETDSFYVSHDSKNKEDELSTFFGNKCKTNLLYIGASLFYTIRVRVK